MSGLGVARRALRDRLLAVLGATGWNISQAAERLRITRNTVRARMEKYGLHAPVPGRLGRPREKPRAVPDTAPFGAATPSHVEPERERRGLALLEATVVPSSAEGGFMEPTRQVEALTEKLENFGGSVERLDSRSVLAVFGLHGVDDWSRRAAAAAIAIRRALLREDHSRFSIKAGIHFGRLSVGRIGGVVTIDAAVKRDARRTLDALLSQAGPDTILVSEAAARLLERRFAVVPANTVDAGGGQAFRLAGPEQPPFGIRGRVSTFVGRHQELALLRSKYSIAAGGRGQSVNILGEAGIGKSRLIAEFYNSIRDDAITYLEGRCVSYGGTIPYLPMLEVIRSFCGITEMDNSATIVDRLRSAMRRVDVPAVDAAPYILQLLGVPQGSDQLRMIGPETMKARTFETLRQLLLKLSEQQPLIVAVEDLHWGDRMSEEFLASLVESISGAAVLVLVTYRPGYRLPWVEKSYVTQIALASLSAEDSLRILNDVIQSTPLRSDMTDHSCPN